MNIALKPELKKFVEKQVKTGRYGSIDEMLAAAIARLMQDDREMEFAPGELQSLVDKGEADIARGNVFSLAETRRHFLNDRVGLRRKKYSNRKK